MDIAFETVPYRPPSFQPYRTPILDNQFGGSSTGAEPAGELLGVGDGGRQADQPDVGRGVDDHLLPDRPPETILQVVDFIEHDRIHGGKVGAGVDHVAEHLGGHHHDRGVMVDGVVSGEQSDPAGPINLPEVTELLVGKGFQRGGVKNSFVVGKA